MARHKIPMTATFVKTVKEEGKYTDGPTGHGLYLRARESEAKGREGKLLKRFYQKCKIRGKWVDLPIGPYPSFFLKDARAIALANIQLIAAGGDPRQEKKKREAVPTLAEAAERHLAVRGVGKSKGYTAKRRGLLRNHASGLLDMKVDTISREDIRNVLASIWESDRVAADNLRILLKLIFRWANGAGHRGDNPNNPADGDVVSQLPDIRHEVENYPSLPFQEIKTLISQIEQATGIFLAARLALTLKVLTGTRSGEIVGSRWDDIDMERKIFTPQDETLPSLYWPCLVIPKERTKTGVEYVIPLSIRAIRVLLEARALSHLHPHLIFPASGGGELSRSRLIDLQHRFTKSVPHGLRNSIKSWGQLLSHQR